jgi:hypothetical protein
MGYLCCSGKMSGDEENSTFKIQCFAHHMPGLKHYIIHVGSPESYDFSGFFKSILAGFGTEFSEIS